jgi:hypothetical protein
MLMGLSFENLLKGLLIAEGMPAVTNGKLVKDFVEHNLGTLADKLEGVTKSQPVFTAEERKLLAEISRFVVWQGRYPIPKASHGYTGGYALNDPDEHKLEQDLWKRLHDRLISIGWHKDTSGKRHKLKVEGSTVYIDSESF